ncbi:hypothetical protein HK101_007395 [Irineochytrium annulatum]|nr:hypothetical protein HK101_007395 [Irineochytrium annulatum]
MSRRFERPLSAASTSAASPVASTLETKSNLRRLSATFEKAAQKPAVMTKKAAGKDIVRSATLPAKVEVKLAEVQSKPKPVAIGGPRPEPIVAPLPELTASPELMPESKVASTLPPEELKTEPISPPEEPKLAFLDDSPATSFLKSLVQPVLNTGVSGGNGGVAMDRTVRRVRSGEDFEGSRADVATAVDGEIASVVAAVEKLVTQERAVEEPVAGVESHVEVLLTTMDEQTPAVVPKTVLPAREEKATVAPVEAVSEITTDPVPSVTSNVKLSVAETAVKVLTVSPVCPAVTEAMEYTTTFDADAIHPSPSPSTSSLHQSLRITQSTRLPSSASHPILHLVFLQLDPSSPGATSVSLRLLFHVRDMDPRRALAVLASDDGWVSSRWSRAGVTLGRVEGRSGWVAYECVVEGVREGVTEFVGRLDMGGQEHWDRGVGGAGHCVRVEWVEAGREVDEEVIVREVGKSWREARQITPLSNDSEDEVDEPLSRQQWRPRPDQAPRLSSPPYRDCASTSPRMDPIPEVEEPVAALWADEIEAMDESVRDATFAVGDGETWDAQMRAVEMCIGVATDAVGMLERELAALFSSSANEADVWVARIDAVIVAPGMGIKAIEAALCVASSAVMFLERECATEKNGAVVELGDGGVEDVERTLSLVASIIEDVERVVAKHVDSGHGSPLPEEMGPVQDGAEGLDVHEMASEIVSIVSSILVGFEETVTTAGPATASSA